MFNFIWRKFKLLKILNKHPAEPVEILHSANTYSTLSENSQRNFEQIKVTFHASPDLVIRKFFIGQIEAAMVVCLEAMSEYQLINEGILGSLMREGGNRDLSKEITLDYLKNKANQFKWKP